MLQESVWSCLVCPLPSSIEVDIEGIGQIEVEVVYPFRPDACLVCMCFGHKDQSCVKGKRVWRPKAPVVTSAVGQGGGSSSPIATSTTGQEGGPIVSPNATPAASQEGGPGVATETSQSVTRVAEADDVSGESQVKVDHPSTPQPAIDAAAGVSALRKVPIQGKLASKKTNGILATNRFSLLDNEDIFEVTKGRVEGYPKRDRRASAKEAELEELSKKKKSLGSEDEGINSAINST